MGNSGPVTKRAFRQPKDACIDWFKEKDSEDEEFMAYAEKIAQEQNADV